MRYLGKIESPQDFATKEYVDAKVESSGGTSIDTELLEAYMPMSRDFSDDFNNDFAR